jgi:hypothetical protein
VRARLAWLAGGIGIGVAAARRALRPSPAEAPPLEEERADPRAEELRRKLAEARTALDEREEFEAAETPVDEVVESVPEPDEEPKDLDERRRRVHDRARAASKRMRETDELGPDERLDAGH